MEWIHFLRKSPLNTKVGVRKMPKVSVNDSRFLLGSAGDEKRYRNLNTPLKTHISPEN